MVFFGAAQVEYYCNKSLWLTSQVYFNSSYFLAFRRDFTQKPKNKIACSDVIMPQRTEEMGIQIAKQ